MNCGDVNLLINKELDSRLTPEERQALYRHLDICPACLAEYHEFHRLDLLLKQRVGAVALPGGFAAGVMAALPAETAQPQPAAALRPHRKARLRWLPMVAVAAGLVLAALFSGVFDPAEAPPLTPEAPIAEVPQDDPPLTPPIANPQPDEPDPVIAEDPAEPDPLPEQPAPPDPEKPADPGAEKPPQTYNNGAPLPTVASGGSQQGEYSLFALAPYAEYDALLPRVSANAVTYYVNADGVYLEYQVLLDGSQAPAFQGETESLPTAARIGGFTDESAKHDFSYITALSPDSLWLAVNQGGDAPGLYLQDNDGGIASLVDSEGGGGDLVCWAPDGNKVLYTDAVGNLHAYYLAEKISLNLYEAKVTSVAWSEDSRTVVFAGADPATGHSTIYRVSVP